MRLFKKSAQFITLIKETIIGIKTFTLIVMIIMMAFGNYYLVANMNQPGIVDKRTGYTVIDSIILIYLLALGEFGDQNYTTDNPKD